MTRLDGVVKVAEGAGSWGVTWQDVANELGLHHGQASGALSRLHRDGALLRLSERRGRSSVYVTPDVVGDRTYVAPRVRKPNVSDDVAVLIQEAYERGLAAGNANGDAQWLSGYDQGKDAGIAEGRKLAEQEGVNAEELTARYVDGYEAGSKEVRERSIKFIDELARNLRTGSPVHIHSRVCWRTQPACALMIARKSLDGGKPPRVEYDY